MWTEVGLTRSSSAAMNASTCSLVIASSRVDIPERSR